MFYKKFTLVEKYGKTSVNSSIDNLINIYEFVLLEDEEENVYRLDMQTMEVERYSLKDLIELFISNQEIKMEIVDDKEEERFLFDLRLFSINHFGGFYSTRIKEQEEYYAKKQEENN